MKRPQAPRSVWYNPIHFCAFGFGSGVSPVAPGTMGTLMAIPFYLLFEGWSWQNYAIVVILMTIIGIWFCDVASKDTGVEDHPGIVWDEFTGYFITMWAAPAGWVWIVLGFLLFRLFDIWKPGPIGWLNDHVKGGLGVMIDDVAAAIPALIIMQILAFIFVRSVV